MQGYWKNEKATAETIDSDGWLYTGDRAVIKEGHIRITGRLKEILVLSNGEKVAPADLEMAIAMDPLFEHNLIIGEGKPYLTLLTVLNAGLWQEFAAELGVSPEPESLGLQQVQDAVLKKIEKLLAHFPGFVFVKHITLSLTPWTVEDGLLTPTLKLKRTAIGSHMREEIEHMYTN
jgi:long-chain acyl-CoA synthetase